jgi:RHS repeat-associated protein
VVHVGGQVEYGLTDAVNSTVATVDQSGAQKGRFTYEPFGQTTAANTNYPFQFTGRVLASSGLYYYRARFYNAATGRFISEDPIGFSGGPNSYSYGRNSPANFGDPLGLCAVYVEKPDHSGVVCVINSPSDPGLLNPIFHQALTNPVTPPSLTSSSGAMRRSGIASRRPKAARSICRGNSPAGLLGRGPNYFNPALIPVIQDIATLLSLFTDGINILDPLGPIDPSQFGYEYPWPGGQGIGCDPNLGCS